jgi:hypothetical protein
VGHIGSALSVADILAALSTNVLHIPDLYDRDCFVLSNESEKDWLTQQDRNTFGSEEKCVLIKPPLSCLEQPFLLKMLSDRKIGVRVKVWGKRSKPR